MEESTLLAATILPAISPASAKAAPAVDEFGWDVGKEIWILAASLASYWDLERFSRELYRLPVSYSYKI